MTPGAAGTTAGDVSSPSQYPVREAVSARAVQFYFVRFKKNVNFALWLIGKFLKPQNK